MENQIYGAVRISTGRQNMERQIRNISNVYPTAKIVCETYTGTKLEGRSEFNNLIKILKEGDSLIFDSASRMSRSADEGCQLYKELFNRGINLIFLKEPQINSSVYKQALETQIKITINTGSTATDNFVNTLIDACNNLLMELAFEQIRIIFLQAEKEVKDLHQKTKEGILTARLAGKQIGQRKGAKLVTKKSIFAKEQIIKYCKDFDGTLSDTDCLKIIGISRNTYYNYKKQLKQNN